MTFAATYGRWALVVGASDGVGAAFADALASRGVDVVLLARREVELRRVADEVARRHGVATRAVALDLVAPEAATRILGAVADLEIGFLVYCAGADADYLPFLESPLSSAEAMVQRNCLVPLQLCHALAAPMVERGRGAVVLIGSGAGFAGAPNMAVYAGSKAFDMVFAEALWAELRPAGVDVLGLILGETDTPALRRLKHARGLSVSADEPVAGAATPEAVVADALLHLRRGPTRLPDKRMRRGLRLLFPVPRNTMVRLVSRMSSKAMGSGSSRG